MHISLEILWSNFRVRNTTKLEVGKIQKKKNKTKKKTKLKEIKKNPNNSILIDAD